MTTIHNSMTPPGYADIQCLPTYEQSISSSTPPPDYASVAAISQHSPFHTLYHTHELTLNAITPSTSTASAEDSIANISFDTYIPQTEFEIENYYMALKLALQDKAKQVSLNTEFVQKRVRTRTKNHYIDRLRESTIKDFSRIEQRILKECTTLDNVFDSLVMHNAMFLEVDMRVKTIQREVDSTEDKEVRQRLLNELVEKLMHRGMIVKNLEMIQEHIAKLSCDDDVSYVLKERAKIYNDAKEVVRRQGHVTV